MKTLVIVLIAILVVYVAWKASGRQAAESPDRKKPQSQAQPPVKVSVPKASTVTISMGEDFVDVSVSEWTEEEMDEATQYYHEESSEVVGDFISEDLMGRFLKGELDQQRSAKMAEKLTRSGIDIDLLRASYVGVSAVEEASKPSLDIPEGALPSREQIDEKVQKVFDGHTEGEGVAEKDDLGDFQPSAVLPRSLPASMKRL